MSKVTKLRNRIRKRRQNKRKELMSFIIFMLIYSIIAGYGTKIIIDCYNLSIPRTNENTHSVTGILEDTWYERSRLSAYRRYFIIDGKQYVCANADTKNGWDNLEIGSNITVIIDNGDENKSKIPVKGVECNGVTNFDLEDKNREAKILSIISTPFFIIAALFAFVILAIRVLAFILTWFYNSEKKLKKKLKEAQNGD